MSVEELRKWEKTKKQAMKRKSTRLFKGQVDKVRREQKTMEREGLNEKSGMAILSRVKVHLASRPPLK